MDYFDLGLTLGKPVLDCRAFEQTLRIDARRLRQVDTVSSEPQYDRREHRVRNAEFAEQSIAGRAVPMMTIRPDVKYPVDVACNIVGNSDFTPHRTAVHRHCFT